MSRPSYKTFARDVIIFGLGIVLILKQAGIIFSPPASGPSVVLIVLGGLFCNGPIVLQALALRFGTGPSSPGPGPADSASPSGPSSASSSEGN